MTDQIQKILAFNKDPQFEVFKSIQEVNDNLKNLTEAVQSSKSDVVSVDNLSDAQTDLTPLEANFEALKASVESVVTAIQSIPQDKEMDMSGIEKLLKDLVNKPVEKIDMSHMETMSGILDNILFAVQTTASHSGDKEENPADKIVPELAKVQKILNLLNENVVAIDIPNFDYEKLARIIKENVQIKVSGGGGPSHVRATIQNGGSDINAATEETVSQLVMAVTNVLTATTFNLNSAAYSATTSVTSDAIISAINFSFSTNQSKTITITSSNGTVLVNEKTTATSFSPVRLVGMGLDATKNLTIAVTQTTGACTMTLEVLVESGSNTLVGNPTVIQGTAGTDPWLTVDIVHQRVHEGRYFSGGYYNAAVADTNTIQLLVQTTAEVTHAVFNATSSGDAYIQLFEGATVSAAGTAVTMSNHNRQSTKVFGGTVTHTPTVTGTGTQVNGTSLMPGGTKSAGSGGEFDGFGAEFVLAASTIYLFRVTNVAGGNAKMDVALKCYQPNL